MRDNAALIDAIAAASGEQASAIAEVSTAVRQMDEMTQHNAALVEETNAAIEQTEGQARDLDRIVDRFRVLDSMAPSGEPAPARVEKATGLKGLQQRVKAAAANYLSHGNAAVNADWNEF